MDNILKAIIKVETPGVAESFKIVSIGVSTTERGLTNLQKALIQTGGGVKTFTNKFSGLIPPLKNVPVAIENTNRALMKLPNAANQATLSMVNLGRVVQDAPFGFLGIANNLNPLLESFQRLKATTGSTGGALKALGSSLLGAGGLGFALSIVSSALIVFGDKLFGAGEASKASEKELERLAARLEEVKDNVKLLADEIQFLNQLGAINVKVIGFGDIEDLRQQFVAQQELYIKLIDARSALVDAQIELSNNEILNEKDLIQAKKENADAIAEIDKQIVDNTRQSILLKQKIRLQNINDEKDADKELERLRKARLQAAQEEYDFQSGLLDLLLSNFKKFQNDRNALFKISESQKIRFKIFADISIDGGSAFKNFAEEFKPVSDELQKLVDRLTKNNPILIKAQLIIDEGKKAAADLQANFENVAKMVSDVLAPAFDSLFDAIVKGENPLKAFFNSVIQSVNQLISKLISAAIQAAVLSLLTGGGGANSFAALFSKILGFRAHGGPVMAGGSYIVGEDGPELFVPNTGGSIIPNTGLNGRSIAGDGTFVTGELLLRGQNLIASLAATNRSQRRLG